MTSTCDLCGATAEAAAVPFTWATSVERGRTRLYCEGCARENLRAIEGRLDRDWW